MGGQGRWSRENWVTRTEEGGALYPPQPVPPASPQRTAKRGQWARGPGGRTETRLDGHAEPGPGPSA